MAVALVSTKRKFNKILDNLTNVSGTSVAVWDGARISSTSSLLSRDEPLTKKVRTSRSNSANTASSSYTNTLRVSTELHPSTSTLKASMDSTRELPNFMPADTGQFLGRLESYNVLSLWGPKPDRVNEVQWAKRGWVLVGEETVGCKGGCEKRLVVNLVRTREPTAGAEGGRESHEEQEDEAVEEIDELLVDKYQALIVNGHYENCLWRRRGCDHLIHRIPLTNPKTALAEFRARYESFQPLIDQLSFKIEGPPEFGIRPALLLFAEGLPTTTASEPARPFTIPPNESDNSISALYLAQFGWHGELSNQSEPQLPLISCKYCFRRIGSWFFFTNPPHLDFFDVIAEHRSYCPWRDPLAQRGRVISQTATHSLHPPENIELKAGWEVMNSIVERTLKYTKREGKKAVRSANMTPRDARPPTDSTSHELPEVSEQLATMLGAGPSETTRVASTAESRAERDERDKERFWKAKFLSKMFCFKKGKKKDGKAGSNTTTQSGESSTSGNRRGGIGAAGTR